MDCSKSSAVLAFSINGGGVHSGLPVVIQLFRRIESLLQRGQDVVENGAAVARVRSGSQMPRWPTEFTVIGNSLKRG